MTANPLPSAQSASGPAVFDAARPNRTAFAPNVFLKNWLVLRYPGFDTAPIAGDREAIKGAFETDVLDVATGAFDPKPGDSVRIRDAEYLWRPLKSIIDSVDLVMPGQQNDYAIAYAYAEVIVRELTETVLGIGSDDSVKVWLNGAAIHEKFIGRPVNIDDDFVKVTLQPGVSRILLKVQNETASWGFACRFVDRNGLSEDLGIAAMNGVPRRVHELIDLGADVNAKAFCRATPLQIARLYGQKEAQAILLDRGATPAVKETSPESIVNALFMSKYGGEGRRRLSDGETDTNGVQFGESVVPGAAVLVSKDGEILFARGYGFANLSDQVPVVPETIFRIGSITKQFVAAGLLALQEEGKLTLTDTISKYLPDFPRGNEVTLHHLLTHTSGIQSFTNKPKFMDTAPLPRTSEEVIESFKDDPYSFDPGDSWAYNNSGYFLLGVVIGKVSGMAYGDYLKQRFFDPLGMADTGVHTSTAILSREAIGYSFEHGQYRKALNWDMSQAGGAGSLYSTVLDLFRWNEALFNGQVLCRTSTEAAWTPVVLNNGRMPSGMSAGYGYGWVSNVLRGIRCLEHSGGLHGFLSNLSRFPNEKLTVVVLQNASPALTNPAGLARDIAQIYLGARMTPYEPAVPAIDLDKSLWPRYAGSYDAGGGATLQVEHIDGRLLVTSNGAAAAPLIAVSDREFCWPDSHDRIAFKVAASRGDDTAMYSQGGIRVTVYRIVEQKEKVIDSDALTRCAGKYDIGTGDIVDVTAGENSLTVTVPGQPVFVLYPKSKTEFFSRDFDMQADYENDEGGRSLRMIITFAGSRFEATRID